MIRNTVERVIDHRHLGRPGRVKGPRELVVAGTPLIVVYRVLDNRLRILAGIHGARQSPEGIGGAPSGLAEGVKV